MALSRIINTILETAQTKSPIIDILISVLVLWGSIAKSQCRFNNENKEVVSTKSLWPKPFNNENRKVFSRDSRLK